MSPTAQRRLLDLLAGWSSFSDDNEHATASERDAIATLYQFIGSCEATPENIDLTLRMIGELVSKPDGW